MSQKPLLLIEDNEIAIKVSLYMLRKNGFAVDVETSAEASYRALASKDYGAILLDLGLPDADGYQVAKKIRELPGYKEITIIALTAHNQDDPHIRKDCFEAGIDDVWSKPLSDLHCEKIKH